MSSGFHLDAADLTGLGEQLGSLGWLRTGERVLAAAKAGEGNMNYTLRVTTSERSVIVKQSRGWVEKYPHIPAPADRIVIEGAFYHAVQPYSRLAKAMPQLLGSDASSRLLLLEDVAPAPDFSFVYRGEPASREELGELVAFLSDLHRVEVTGELFENRSMRLLNHEHIFELPLRPENGLDLDGITPGLAKLADELQHDTEYVRRVRLLGDMYLAHGRALLHGDFFPGSWLRTESGPKVIDPEFCFYGPPEFDLAVMTAHLRMAGLEFDPASVYFGQFDIRLMSRFTGVEIMRRLIGVAQLPLELSLEQKAALLRESRRLVTQ